MPGLFEFLLDLRNGRRETGLAKPIDADVLRSLWLFWRLLALSENRLVLDEQFTWRDIQIQQQGFLPV